MWCQMVNITLSVPVGLKKKMDEHDEIKWSGVIRSVLEERIALMEELDNVAEANHISEEDVDVLTKSFNEGLRKRVDAMFDETGHRR